VKEIGNVTGRDGCEKTRKKTEVGDVKKRQLAVFIAQAPFSFSR